MRYRQVLQVTGLLAGVLHLMPAIADSGKVFLEKNAKKPGVVTTDSGLQYVVVKVGDGPSPRSTDLVKVHYHGTLIDGKVFDSSVERGIAASFAMNQVIKGWTEGLQTMRQGGKTTFYIPPHIAYGDREVGSIPVNSTLIFAVELLKVFQLNTPKTMPEIRAFKMTTMDCGKPPALPEDKSQLASVKEAADVFIACVSDYYKYATMQLEGLVRAAQDSDEEMRAAVLGKLQDGKKVMAAQLEPAANFVKGYEKMQVP